MKVTKKDLIRKKQKGENCHWEGKYFCDIVALARLR